MELYHNQETRPRGSSSLRMFHRLWGIRMTQENISAPCSVVDFPTREAFARQPTTEHHDTVGVSSIIVNVTIIRWSTVHPRISPLRSNRRSAIRPISTSSCSTRRFRKRRSTRRWRSRDACYWTLTLSISMRSSNSIVPARGNFARLIRSDSWIGHSGAISRATRRAFIACAGPS
jgi:hypothetical protein